MNAARWSTVQTLFEAALDQPEAEREAFLRDACEGDAELFDEVASLLDVEVHHLLRGLALDAVDLPAVLSMEGARIGPYRIVREIGRGGMGVVYIAERADGAYEQTVALKLIKRGMDSEAVVRRFEQERQILARLQHPTIARLLDGGLAEDGRPYFAMEYVEGEPIDAYCDAHALPVEERLRLVERVCEAVAYAHRNLIVHRDLKPSNVLVTADGDVKLLDFGIARLLDADGPGLTWSGLRPMTPEYAAPEQVRGEAPTVSTDVYALGVLLYELLAGRRPHPVDRSDLRAAERAILEVAPDRPSHAVRTPHSSDEGHVPRTPEAVSRQRSTTVDRLARRLAGDLDTITLKALRKEPDERYVSAEALAADLHRHQHGQPVLARQPTTGYRVRKFVMRHRAGVAATAGVVALLAALIGFYTARLTTERDRAQREADKADEVAQFLSGLFEQSDPLEALGDTLSVRTLLERGTARIDRDLTAQPRLRADLLSVLGDIHLNLGVPARAVDLLEQSATLRRAHPTTPLDLANTLRSLGTALMRLDRTDEASMVVTEALNTLEAQYGRSHPETAKALRDLGRLVQDDGDYEQAEAYLREALAAQRTNPMTTTDDLSLTLNDLGELMERVGRPQEAEPLLRTALDLDRAQLGDLHPRVAAGLSNLGIVQRELGDNEAAEANLREALAIDRAVYGPDHLETATAMRNLASLLRDRDAFDEAEELYDAALAIRRERLGSNHPRVANLLNSMGRLYTEIGDLDAAVATYEEALSIYRRSTSVEPVLLAPALHNLAGILEDQRKPDEAEALYRESLAILREGIRPGSSDLAFPLVSLGTLLTERGNYAEAEPLLREATDLRRTALPPDHRLTALTERRLSDALVGMEAFEQAESILAASIARLRKASADASLIEQAEDRLRTVQSRSLREAATE